MLRSLQLINDPSASGHQETNTEARKRTARKTKETISGLHSRQKEFALPPSRVENLVIVRVLVEYSEDCHLNCVG